MFWCNQSVHAIFLAFVMLQSFPRIIFPTPDIVCLWLASKVGYQFVAVNDCCRSRLENLEECLVGVAGKPTPRKPEKETRRTHPHYTGELRKDSYSPVGRTGVVATVVATTSSPVTSRARRASVRLAAVAVHVWVRLVAGPTTTAGRRARRSTVAVIHVATRWRVVVKWGRTSATRRRAIAVVARVVVVARRRGTTTVVVTARAVATRRTAAVVVVVHGRTTVAAVTTVTTAAVARRAGAVTGLTGTWNLGLRL